MEPRIVNGEEVPVTDLWRPPDHKEISNLSVQ